MTIYPPKAAPFNCVICNKPGPPDWDNSNRPTVAPLCYRCEVEWGGGSGLHSKMDDRLSAQIYALSQALHWNAIWVQNGVDINNVRA